MADFALWNDILSCSEYYKKVKPLYSKKQVHVLYTFWIKILNYAKYRKVKESKSFTFPEIHESEEKINSNVFQIKYNFNNVTKGMFRYNLVGDLGKM